VSVGDRSTIRPAPTVDPARFDSSSPSASSPRPSARASSTTDKPGQNRNAGQGPSVLDQLGDFIDETDNGGDTD
jgi:hypothetical protein